MGRPFYDVLYAYECIDENREIFKCFVDEEFNVKIKYCNNVANLLIIIINNNANYTFIIMLIVFETS